MAHTSQICSQARLPLGTLSSAQRGLSARGLAPFPNGACPLSFPRPWRERVRVGGILSLRAPSFCHCERSTVSLRAEQSNLNLDQKSEAGGSGGEMESDPISA